MWLKLTDQKDRPILVNMAVAQTVTKFDNSGYPGLNARIDFCVQDISGENSIVVKETVEAIHEAIKSF